MTVSRSHLTIATVVGVGAAIGAVVRWSLEDAWPAPNGGFPWTTFGINVVGTLLLALLPAVAWVRRTPLAAPALGTGLLGGFTTLSAYSEETRALLDGGHVGLAATYAFGTLAACLITVACVDAAVPRRAREEFEAAEGDL